MLARLCRHSHQGELKRRYSWSSGVDQAEPEVEGTSGEAAGQDEDRHSYKENGCAVQTVDLVADCPSQLVTSTSSRSPSPSKIMGQRPSNILRPKISLTWVLRNQQHPNVTGHPVSHSNTPNNLNYGPSTNPGHLPRDKERSSRRSVKSTKEKDRSKENVNLEKKEKRILQTIENFERIEKTAVKDNAIENNYPLKDVKEKVKKAVSEPSLVCREFTLTPGAREKHKHRRTKRSHKTRPPNRFGYEINDLDAFLTKASIEKPANIPVVLSFPSVLYQTQGGTQDEIALPLGTVVNAVFKNQGWLYVQTPHGQEGYVSYSACLPLGILPQPTTGPCWEDSTDVFPRPLGNMTDTEKLRDTRSECGSRGRNSRMRRSSKDAISACGERSVDRLYLRAAINAKTKGYRHTLLVIRKDYEGQNGNVLSVSKGDVVALLSDHVNDWFFVRSRDGREGFIPAVIAGHCFL
ncbi:uncharacterized protein [Prorops nasuta]